MSKVIKFLPGLIGAAVAFVAVKLVAVLALESIALEFLVFVCTYLIVAVLLEHAMTRYGTPER